MEKTANSFLIDLKHPQLCVEGRGQSDRFNPPHFAKHPVGCSRPGLGVAVTAYGCLATVSLQVSALCYYRRTF